MSVKPFHFLVAGLSTIALVGCGKHAGKDAAGSNGVPTQIAPTSDAAAKTAALPAAGAGSAPSGEHVSAENDSIIPPKAYYDAIVKDTLENLDKKGSLSLAASKQVLWVNFDGATVTKGFGKGQSFIPCNAGGATIPASGIAAADQATILAQVAAYYSGVNAGLVITAKQPATGDFTTLHVGGTYATLGCIGNGVLGVAPLDKGNRSATDVGFVFSGVSKDNRTMAITIAHEAGHTFGLDHVSQQADIMYPAVNNKITGFLNSTVGLMAQNEAQILQTVLGADKAMIADSGSALVPQAAPVASAKPATPAPAAPPAAVGANPLAGLGAAGADPLAGLGNLAGLINPADLSKLLANLGNLGGLGSLLNNPDLMKTITALSSSVFGLSGAKDPADFIGVLQTAAKAIVANFSGADKDQLLGLLKAVGASQYASLVGL